eukprot:Sspe_Gene.41394::Locus_20008_Transcript_1_1_Confidence_1.000_Length_526::g.41394::m.41394
MATTSEAMRKADLAAALEAGAKRVLEGEELPPDVLQTLSALIPPTDKTPRRVLVTGFMDFPCPNLLQLERNASGLLLADGSTRWDGYSGILVKKLRLEHREVSWTFLTLPVVWQACTLVDYAAYDTVIHIGETRMDEDDEKMLILEDGAFNARNGEDNSKKTFV